MNFSGSISEQIHQTKHALSMNALVEGTISDSYQEYFLSFTGYTMATFQQKDSLKTCDRPYTLTLTSKSDVRKIQANP